MTAAQQTEVKIVEATKADSDNLGLILASVFRDHPLYVYMKKDPEKRLKMAQWINKRVVAYGLVYGTVFTDENRIGTSVIMPTGDGALTIPRMVRLGLLQAPFKMGLGGFRKFMKFSMETESVRKRHMTGPHYLQLTVGVNPDVQGKGVGSALLQAGIELAESHGQDAYAETVLEDVVGWYDRYGYKTVAETPVPHIGTLYSMVRRVGA